MKLELCVTGSGSEVRCLAGTRDDRGPASATACRAALAVTGWSPRASCGTPLRAVREAVLRSGRRAEA